MSDFVTVQSKHEDVIKNINDARRAAEANDGKIGQLRTAVDDLTGGLRELRNLHTKMQAAEPVRTHGTERDLRDLYAVQADAVDASRMVNLADNRELVTYGDYDKGTPGREFYAAKDSEVAVRFLSQWDNDGYCHPGLIDDPQPKTEWQARFQDLCSKRTLVRFMCARQDPRPGGRIIAGATPQLDADIARHLRRGPEFLRKFAVADNSTEGAELIPDVALPTLSRIVELPRNVAAMIETQMIPTGGSTINPYLVSGCQPFIVGVPGAGDLDPASIQRSQPEYTTINTAPKTWGVSLPASRDATEDSVIEWGAHGLMLLAEALRDGEEDAIINADTNGGDTALASWDILARWPVLGSANDHRKSWIGWRHQSIDVSAHSALSTESAVGLLAELISLDSPQFLDDVAFVMNPLWLYLKLLTDTNLLTVDKYGSLATLLTGEVARVGGKPIVISEFVDTHYNASGVYDGVTTTKTGVLAVNRKRWAMGVRRGPRVELETRPGQHITLLVASQRKALRHLGRSTEKSVGWYYNASTT